MDTRVDPPALKSAIGPTGNSREERVVGVQANFPMLFTDPGDSVTFQPRSDRVSYKVLSDVSLPSESLLRSDREPYPQEMANYLQLPPKFDTRIESLARTITANSRTRYDTAKAVEEYLQTQIGYTLEQKAGGDDPLADFLFNVREGHCEYFATAMAIMATLEVRRLRVIACRRATAASGEMPS